MLTPFPARRCGCTSPRIARPSTALALVLCAHFISDTDATTLSQVVEGHSVVLTSPNEGAALLFAVIAFCALLTVLLTALERSKRPLVQSFFIATTRVVLVIGANSVLLSFVAGLFEAGRIEEDVLLVLTWVYFVFFFFMIGLVLFSLFGVLVISLIVQRQCALEKTIIESSGFEATTSVALPRSTGREELSKSFASDAKPRGSSFFGSSMLLQNLSVFAEGLLGSEANADRMRKLRFIYLQSAVVAFPHLISTILRSCLTDYVAALQQWDASTLTDLRKRDWSGIFVSVVVNTIRVRVVFAIRGTAGTRTDFYSFFALLGVAPCALYLYSTIALILGLRRYTDEAFESLVALKLRRSSRVVGLTADGIELFASPHLLTTGDMASPAQYVQRQNFVLFSSLARMCLLQQLFYLILFTMQFATTAGPLWLCLSLLPPAVTFATLPVLALSMSLLTGLGSQVQHSTMLNCLQRDAACSAADGTRPSKAFSSPRDAVSGGGVDLGRSNGEGGRGSGITMLSSPKQQADAAQEHRQATDLHSGSDEADAHSQVGTEHVAEAAEELGYDEALQSSLAALESGRHRGEAPRPRKSRFDPSARNVTDTFHLYCALEQARNDYESQAARNELLEKQLRRELCATSTLAKHLTVLKELLTDRITLNQVPVDGMDWGLLQQYAVLTAAPLNGGDREQLAHEGDAHSALHRAYTNYLKPTENPLALRNQVKCVMDKL